MSAAPSDPHPASVVVLVPIYQPALSALETYSLDHSLPLLQGREVRFIGPRGLDLSLYKSRYPGVQFDAFEPDDFASIPGYNRLLLYRFNFSGTKAMVLCHVFIGNSFGYRNIIIPILTSGFLF